MCESIGHRLLQDPKRVMTIFKKYCARLRLFLPFPFELNAPSLLPGCLWLDPVQAINPSFWGKNIIADLWKKNYSIDDDDIGWDREADKEKEEDKERKNKAKTKNIGRRIIPTAKPSVRRIRKRRIWERRIIPRQTRHPTISFSRSVGWLVCRSPFYFLSQFYFFKSF